MLSPSYSSSDSFFFFPPLFAAFGRSECDIPPPETTGPIVLSFDTSLTSELSYRAIEAEAYDFTFIATGDNDADTDCAHETFFFEAEVSTLKL